MSDSLPPGATVVQTPGAQLATPSGIRAVAKRLSPELKVYLKLLQETFGGPKLAPAETLPLPKQDLRRLIFTELGQPGNPDAIEVLAFLAGGLELFYVGDPSNPARKMTDRAFAWKIVGIPSLLLVLSGIVLGLRGHTWWYLTAGPVFYIAANIDLTIREVLAIAQSRTEFWWHLAQVPLELVSFLGAFAVTWFTLVFAEIIGGVLGLIQNPSLGAAAALAVAAFLGYHLSKAGNTFYYFMHSAPWAGRGST